MALMSTKVTLRHGEQFQLYRDCFDEDLATAPLYLTLRNVSFECRQSEHGSEVTVSIPAAVARALGLLVADDRTDG
jgi:hypothetical protein